MSKIASVQSEGDLEVIILHETHGALAEIIGPDLYVVGGSAPDQSVQFHDRPHFNLFLILLIELFAEGQRNAISDGKYQNWSLVKGLDWFCRKHAAEANRAELDSALASLQSWAANVEVCRFWCPDVDTHVELLMSNNDLISFGANTAKHHLLRLSDLLQRVNRLCTKAGYEFSPQQTIPVLNCMTDEVRSRLMYHSTFLIELLGCVFLALNRVIKNRHDENPTNYVSKMCFPHGVTSDVFRDLYGSVLVFKRYEDQRILQYTPVTTRHLKRRYSDFLDLHR